MHFAGVLPEDAPDPRIEWAAQLTQFPIPVMSLVSQPTLEDTGQVGSQSSTHGEEYVERTAIVSYALWRNPDDRADPVNLADLDERTRQSLDEVPPWPRPAWLIELVEQMRFAQLGDAVRTTWRREAMDAASVRELLLHHAEHVLNNQFRRELARKHDPARSTWFELSPAALDDRASIRVDGVTTDAVQLDTDPLVYGIGALLPSRGVATVVIPRDELRHVQIELATRIPPRL